MDHLPQPLHPIFPNIRIPNYCKESDAYNRGQDFTSFPEQHGWSKRKLRNLDLDEGQTTESLLSILQAWLFFGVLRSVINVRFELSDFICENEETNVAQQFITTHTLPELVARWYAATKPTEAEINSSAPPEKIERYRQMMQEAQRIRDIFEEANMTLISISFAAARNPDVVPQALLLCIEVLLSGLSNAAIFMYGIEKMASVGSAASIDFQAMGMFLDWCPLMFRRLKAVLNSSACYVVGRSAVFEVPRLHNGCTADECKSERVDENLYVVAHCCAEGNCEFKGPKQSVVEAILDHDDYPVLLLRDCADESISIDVVQAKESPPYVAISHVWTHGLGNPRANTMPLCQLRRLCRLVQQCTGQEVAALWMDTLLCPLEGRYCDLAIGKMVPTYRDAQLVLVLDEGVQQTARNLAPVEILARIASSMWMQRLWTLQEGALNRRVILQLADGQCDYDELLRAVGDSHLIDTCYETASRDLLNACQTLRLNGVPERPGQNLDFGMWINMLQYRKTSELRDESLCLATLLGHDLKAIVPLTPEERLIMIYESQHVFPWNLIFLSHTKMSHDGMKWAPQTYLENGNGYGGTLLSAPTHFKAVFLLGLGLVLDLPSYNFKSSDRITIPMMFQDPRSGFVFIVASTTSQEMVEHRPATMPHWTGEFSLVFETRRDSASGRSVMAVLTTCDEVINPTPETAASLDILERPDQSFRRMHFVQQVVVGLEPRFGRVAHTDDIGHVIDATMPNKRVCIA